jgi:hypothetical protein
VEVSFKRCEEEAIKPEDQRALERFVSELPLDGYKGSRAALNFFKGPEQVLYRLSSDS